MSGARGGEWCGRQSSHPSGQHSVPRFLCPTLPLPALLSKPVDTALLVLLAFTPPVVLFADKAIVLITSVVAAAGLLHLLLQRDLRPARPGIATVVLLLLGLLGACSTLWSIDVQRSLRAVLGMAGFIAIAILLLAWVPGFSARRDGTAIASAAAAGLILTSGLFVFGALNWTPEYELSSYNRPLCLLLLVSWPVGALLWHQQRWILLMIIAASVVATILLAVSAAAKLALLAGVVAVLLAACLRAGVAMIILGSAVLALITMQVPLLYHVVEAFPQPDWLPSSAYHRIEIYDFATRAILERPWLGWGLSTFRLFPVGSDELAGFVYLKAMPPHVHNNFLEAWFDLGFLACCWYRHYRWRRCAGP